MFDRDVMVCIRCVAPVQSRSVQSSAHTSIVAPLPVSSRLQHVFCLWVRLVYLAGKSVFSQSRLFGNALGVVQAQEKSTCNSRL
jgi:hypothetical protein